MPTGLHIADKYVYVSDNNHHPIVVYETLGQFVTISSHGKERVKFNQPFDVKFDTAGNMYVADLSNNRVQVMNSSGQFI